VRWSESFPAAHHTRRTGTCPDWPEARWRRTCEGSYWCWRSVQGL